MRCHGAAVHRVVDDLDMRERGHDRPERTASARFHDDVNDRPGSRGPEATGVAGPGQSVPG
jgi:hypothetical protein